MPPCVHERVTECVSLAVWCILPALDQCHISPCRSVSQGKSWAKGWQSLALMDKSANTFFSTNLSSVAHSPGALTSISDCSRSVTHKIYKTCRITPFLTSPLSHTHMHAHMLLQWSPSPAACVLCLREVVLGGRVGLSFPYADTVLHYTHCARKQQKDNDILYRRL